MANHIVIALGGTGGRILKAFRERMFNEYTNEEERSNMPISFIYVDSDDLLMKSKWKDTGIDCSIEKAGIVYIKQADFLGIKQDIQNKELINPWFGDMVDWDKLQSLRAEQGAAQLRRLGRIYLAANIDKFNTALSNSFNQCRKKSGSVENTTVHIISGISGGTGSGTLIDMIAQQINQFPRSSDAKILVYCVLPEKNANDVKTAPGYYYANAYACLSELNKIALGHPEAGKGYEPFDISGRTIAVEKRIRPRFKSCYLFQDINEKDKTVNIDSELPKIISDYLFQYIFRLTNINARDAIQKLTENSSTTVEKDRFSGKDERAFDFASVGIKRLEIPEQDIIDYFSFDIAKFAFLQLKFNNWNKGVGYKNEKKEDLMHEVKKFTDLTLEFLSLSTPIQKEDIEQRFSSIDEDWNSRGINHLKNTLSRIKQTKSEKGNSIDVLAGYYIYHFKSTFRSQGVASYWANKRQNIDSIAQIFFNRIQEQLFDMWVGDPSNFLSVVSLTGIQYLINKLKEKLDEISKDAQEQILKFDNAKFDTNTAEYSIRGCDNEIAEIKKQLNSFRMVTSDETLITRADGFLLKKYKYLTRKEAYSYAIEIIKYVNSKLNTLSNYVDGLIKTVDASIAKIDKELIPKNMWVVDKKKSIIDSSIEIQRLHDENRIMQLRAELLNDDTIYPSEAYTIRKKLQSSIGLKKDFGQLNEEINEDYLTNDFLYFVKSRIKDIQNKLINANLVLNEEKKLVGNNIFHYLRKNFTSDEKLADLFTSLMDSAGVFMQYSNKELPLSEPKQNTLAWVITMPEYSNERFVEKIKNIIIGHIGAEASVVFATNDKDNEIVFLKVAQALPLRVFKLVEETLLPQYINASTNKAFEDKSKVILHTEGTYRDYPPLIPFNTAQTKNAINEHFDNILLPYLLIGLCIDYVKSYSGKYFVDKEVPMVITEEGRRLYQSKDYIYPDRLNANRRYYIEEATHIIAEIDEKLKTANIQKDKQLRESVIKKLSDEVVPSILTADYAGDILDTEFLKIKKATANAISLLK